MDALTGCEIEDVFCSARPGPPKPGRGALVPCFLCGRRACLSCSVRIPVTIPATGRLLGTHMVCHSCAKRVINGPDAVRLHFARMGGRGVPSQAPEAPSRVVLSAPPPKPKPKKKAAKKRKPKTISMEGAERAPTTYQSSTYYTQREEPVEPTACPPHLMKELGYAKH